METTEHQHVMEYSIPRASDMERIELCPASFFAEQSIPEAQPSADAERGTALHEHMAKGTTPEDPEEAELVESCRVCESNLLQSFGFLDYETTREKRLYAKGSTFTGKPDVVFTSGNKALVIDYKFGRLSPTPPEANLQLESYALLLFDSNPAIQTVRAAFISPYMPEVNRQHKLFVRSELTKMRSRAMLRLQKAYEGNAALNPGEKQCRYCKAAKVCPALQNKLARQTENLAGNSWASMPLEKKREAYTLAKLAKRWAAEVESACKQDLKAGKSIPGLTLREGSEKAVVTDVRKAYLLTNMAFGLSPEDFNAACSVKLGALEKTVNAKLKESNPKQTLVATKKRLREELETVLEVKRTEPQLVELSV